MITLSQNGTTAYNVENAFAIRLEDTSTDKKKYAAYKDFSHVIILYHDKKAGSFLAGYTDRKKAENAFYGLLRAFADGVAVYDFNGALIEERKEEEEKKEDAMAEIEELLGIPTDKEEPEIEEEER